MIEYQDDATGVSPEQLQGFFEGWPDPPSPETHLRILEGSDVIALAIDTRHSAADVVVGFATAITDGVLAAYIPLLEVRTAYRGRGIGRELMDRVLARLSNIYMIDLVADPDLDGFYTPLGFQPYSAFIIRNRRRQSGGSILGESS